MDIGIKIQGLENVATRLAAVPKGAEWAIRNSIKEALSKARTTADREIRSRYGVRQATVLAAIGRPHVSSLYGILRSNGKRLLTQDIVGVKSGAGGVSIPWLKGNPAIYPHAFQHGKDGAVLERDTSSRYPLHAIGSPLSVPEMMNQHADVQPKIEAATETEFYKELERLIRLVLTTGAVPKSKWGPK